MHQQKQDFSVFKTRRKELLAHLKERYPHKKNSIVLFIADFEHDHMRFWQESSFFYFSGITEPATVLVIDGDEQTTLYMPNCGDVREKWIYSPIRLSQDNAKRLGIDTITVLGDRCAGYQLFPFFKQASYGNIVALLQSLVKEKGTLFTLYPDNEHAYVEQRLVLQRLQIMIPGLQEVISDISPIVADMRRRKDSFEIDRIAKAIDITVLAQEAAAHAIEDGILECEVQASLEYMITGSASRPAFPSIVASGKNATILHYMQNEGVLHNGELVVIDIGAVYDGYCADLTRTYPVSGTFSKRQRELYQIVLDTQQYIADIAMPGMYLNNVDHPDTSLHHIAQKYLKKYGYDHYFIHGIGHFLGLDVHDVGNGKVPLKEHDVFTIEPGIYIPAEGIGIRIEDDFWMAKKGVVCLSEQLPSDPAAIELLVQQSLQDENQIDDADIEHLSSMEDHMEH
jgi:Xaa-Pro aminopeptidase